MVDSNESVSQQPPWYRQFWPWFLIALPLCAVLGSLFTIYLAASAPDPIIKADRYEKLGPVITESRDR